jgi:hypothetical protein
MLAFALALCAEAVAIGLFVTMLLTWALIIGGAI